MVVVFFASAGGGMMSSFSSDIVTEDIRPSLICLLMVAIDCVGGVTKSSFFVLFGKANDHVLGLVVLLTG